MVCKIFVWSEFPDITGKSWGRRGWRKPTNTKRFAFQANTMKHPTKKLF